MQTKMLDLNHKVFEEKDEWYYSFCYALIYEVSEFRDPLQLMAEKEKLRTQY